MRRASVVTLATLVVLVALPVAAQQPVLGPGLEPEVSRLVLPGSDPPELEDDVRVEGIRIEPTSIEVHVGDGTRAATIALVERSATIDGWRAGETASFGVWLRDGLDDPVMRRATVALATRVRGRDAGDFFDHASPPTQSDRPHFSTPAHYHTLRTARAVAWTALAMGLLALALWAVRTGARPSREDVALAVGAFALAALLRAVIPPWAPLHANDHGIAEMRGLTGDLAGYQAWLYGSGYLHAVRFAAIAFGRDPEVPFFVAWLAGSTIAPLAFALARAIAPGERAGAALVGLAVAIDPVMIRLASSESPKPLACALWWLGATLATLAFRKTMSPGARDLACVMAALAWSLALELHVLTMLLPMAGAALVLVGAGARAHAPRWPATLLGVALVAASAWAHVEELAYARTAAAERDFDIERMLFEVIGRHDALFDPTLTPVALLPLAVLGAIGLARAGHTRWVIGASIAVAILLPPSLLIDACRTDAIRYQAEARLPLQMLLVGVPIATSRSARSVVWLGLAALVASVLPAWRDVATPDVHAQAYAIARADAPAPPTAILVAPPIMRDAPHVLAEYPDYAIAMPRRVSEHAPRDGSCRAWIGVSCWSFTREELDAGARGIELAAGSPMRAECVDLLGGLDAARAALPELHAVSVPHRAAEFHRIVAAEPRVGYAPCPIDSRPPLRAFSADSSAGGALGVPAQPENR